jgi:hypothetical protein
MKTSPKNRNTFAGSAAARLALDQRAEFPVVAAVARRPGDDFPAFVIAD